MTMSIQAVLKGLVNSDLRRVDTVFGFYATVPNLSQDPRAVTAVRYQK